MSEVNRLLFVCAGNICRSPMAEALFRDLAKTHSALETLEIASAGTIAINGNLPSTDSVEVTRREFGLEIAMHRARPLTRRLDADLILTMDRDTERGAKELKLRGRVEMLGDYVGTGEEVPDPYGRSTRHYREVAQQLERLIGLLVGRLAIGGAEAPKL
jgi:protein-tyrosine-phosphatase